MKQKKNEKKKRSKKKKEPTKLNWSLLILSLVVAIIIVYYLSQPKVNNTESPNKVYEGAILKANHSAIMLDELAGDTNIVISPINVINPLIAFSKVSDNNTKKEIANFLPKDIEEKSNELLKKCQPVTKSVSKEETYYEKLMTDLTTYTNLTQNQFNKLSTENKNNLRLLVKKLTLTYALLTDQTTSSLDKIDGIKLTKEDLNASYVTIMANIRQIKKDYENYQIKNQVVCLNNIYYDNTKYTILDEKLPNTLQEQNYINLIGLPFQELPSLKTINEPFKQVSSNKVNYLLEEDELFDSSLLALGTTYFNYKWATAIDSNLTTLEEFFYQEEQSTPVDMMHTTEDLYLENNNAKGFIKNFEGDKYSFVGLLPNQFSAKVSELNLENLLASAKADTKVDVSLPKFSFVSKTSLKKYYNLHNINDLFNENANLNPLSANKDLYLSDVYNKNYIEIGDKGTVSSTIDDKELKSYTIDNQNKQLTFNRPFYFLIMDNETQDILLIGHFVQP